MKYAYFGVILTLAALPVSVITNPLPLLVFLILYITWLTVYKKKGVSYILVAMAMCIAYTPGLDDGMSEYFGELFRWVYRAIYLGIIIVALCNLKIYQIKRYKPILGATIIVILFASFYGLEETKTYTFKLLTIPVFFYICYQERLTLDELAKILKILFIGVGGYALLDFLLALGPYMFVYQLSALYEMGDIHRANGILGNSLSLSAIASGYYAFLLIQYYLTKKTDYFALVFCLLVLLATGSRTSIVITLLLTLFFFVYLVRNISKMVSIAIPMALFFVILFGFVEMYFSEHVDTMFERFENGDEHRMSGFATTWNIFSSNPLGVGTAGMENALVRHAAAGFAAHLKTIDNFYLTTVAKYGVLSVIMILFFLIYPILATILSKHNVKYRTAAFWFIPWLLAGMSFGVDGYLPVTLLYFGTAGHLFRIVENTQKNGLVNNNSQL